MVPAAFNRDFSFVDENGSRGGIYHLGTGITTPRVKLPENSHLGFNFWLSLDRSSPFLSLIYEHCSIFIERMKILTPSMVFNSKTSVIEGWRQCRSLMSWFSTAINEPLVSNSGPLDGDTTVHCNETPDDADLLGRYDDIFEKKMKYFRYISFVT